MGTDGLFPGSNNRRCVAGDTCGGSCCPAYGVNREVSGERNGLRSICEVLAQFLCGQRDGAVLRVRALRSMKQRHFGAGIFYRWCLRAQFVFDIYASNGIRGSRICGARYFQATAFFGIDL